LVRGRSLALFSVYAVASRRKEAVLFEKGTKKLFAQNVIQEVKFYIRDLMRLPSMYLWYSDGVLVT
jgi:hypothetical protein